MLLLLACAPAGGAQRVAAATVPLLVEGNRPYVDLTFTKPDGTKRKARFLLDTGGGGFLMGEPLAKELGIAWGETMREEGTQFAVAKSAPVVAVGDKTLTLNPQRVLVLVGSAGPLPKAAPGSAEGMLPGHVLSQYHVVFDYPGATFTVADAGVLTPRGDASPMPVGRTGFPRTEITVDGKTYGMLLDTGASFTMVSDALLREWGREHTDWPRYPGAHGEAATLGGQTIETMYLPAMRWRGMELKDAGVTSQRTGTFEQWMSGMMTAPIMGSLAGNVLKQFRVELDYPHATLYLSRNK